LWLIRAPEASRQTLFGSVSRSDTAPGFVELIARALDRATPTENSGQALRIAAFQQAKTGGALFFASIFALPDCRFCLRANEDGAARV